jgi:soluble lytic murein transglycosylase-like protein
VPSSNRERVRAPPSFAIRALVAAACAWPLVAFADVWAYVDEQGHSYVADHRVDKRYHLFFKAPATRDAAAERAKAVAALAGTSLYARATNPVLVAKYAALIDANATTNDLDPALVKAVVAAESGFDPDAVSDQGAVGLMQVLPDTAERYGLAADRRHTLAERLRDPVVNVRIGARYLHDLLARFGGDVSLALAAYNAGEGAVASRANRIPPYEETRNYVTRVRQLYAIYRRERPTDRQADVASE